MPFRKNALFPTHIYQFTHPNAVVENPIWRQSIYKLKERDPGRAVSNYSGWHSSLPLQQVPELASLARFILGCLREVASDEGWDLERFDIAMEGWANVNNRGAMNNFHNHPNSLLSGCYYIDTPPDSGDIVFRDPREIAYMFQPPYLRGTRAPVLPITPEPGMLLVFPAWLVHAVAPSASSADRISIAVNATVEPRPQGLRRPKT